jgi:DNA-binding response OmpR family regulator
MAGERVLVIEDDLAMRRGLSDNFQFAGYDVRSAADGEAGLRIALEEKPDLIVLDIMLPRLNGYEVCRRVREQGLDMPIIMLTAKGHESDIVLGLDLGADDYVTKPFGIRELLARAKAFLRRRHLGEQEVHRFGRFTLDLSARRLTADGREVVLTPKELALLAFLVRQAGRALTRDAILRGVWGRDVFVTARSVDRCVTTLRGKIETDPRRPTYIQTVREIGYRFECPDEPPLK